MRSLHVMLHVALLGEPDVAHLTLEGLLSSVFDHVDLQSALLVEGLVTLSALERPLTCSNTQFNQYQQMLTRHVQKLTHTVSVLSKDSLLIHKQLNKPLPLMDDISLLFL